MKCEMYNVNFLNNSFKVSLLTSFKNNYSERVCILEMQDIEENYRILEILNEKLKKLGDSL